MLLYSTRVQKGKPFSDGEFLKDCVRWPMKCVQQMKVSLELFQFAALNGQIYGPWLSLSYH